MSWDESLFKFFYKRFKPRFLTRKTDHSQESLSPHVVFLEDELRRLSVLASLVFEDSIKITGTENVGGLISKTFYLPFFCDRFKSSKLNSLYYVHRLCLYAPNALSRGNLLKDLYIEWEKTSHSTQEQFWFNGPPPVQSSSDEENFVDQERMNTPLENESRQRAYKSEKMFRPQIMPYVEQEENPSIHIFDHTKTAEEYSSGNRSLDGSDELDTQSEALSEINFGKVILTNKSAETYLEVNNTFFLDNRSNLASDVGSHNKILYHEWDYEKNTYKKSWCTLHEEFFIEKKASSKVPSCLQMRQFFLQIVNEPRLQKNQTNGQDINLNSVVRWFVDRRAGIEMSPRIYEFKKKLNQDASVLLLMDMSQSTDSYVKNERVLDLFKHVVELLADSMESVGMTFMVAGFYSNTRHESHFVSFKKFEDTWRQSYAHFQNAVPTGYSRIGPAIRHSLNILNKRNERKKILFVLSDAKPTDYDAYEGNYGMHDVKKTIEESLAQRIDVHCLAFAKKFSPEHRFMFGLHRIDLIQSRRMLPFQLYQIFKKIFQRKV